MVNPEMRIGIDLGGTKIEALAIDSKGSELARYRIDTPRDDYDATVKAIVGLVHRLEEETGRVASVGAGVPGSVSYLTGFIKNSNSTWLNGRPLHRDLSVALTREVRVANDANCLAVSEATDGAAAGKHVVFGVILGTGCGGGIAIDGDVHAGPNGVADTGGISGTGLLLRQARMHGDVGFRHRHRAGLQKRDRQRTNGAGDYVGVRCRRFRGYSYS